ncbi:MAG TPA: RND family transporter, partial [Natrialbaceae archaeon]|nr:RND family transporter [Natrialbaceae archaeon]
MSDGSRIVRAITEHSRVTIALMLLLTGVFVAGLPMMERSTSLDQFQADTDEADALDYAETNFTSSRGNATVAQIVVRDDNVLDRESLLSLLEYEQALRANETITETLVEEDAIRSVADVVAKASIRQ